MKRGRDVLRSTLSHASNAAQLFGTCSANSRDAPELSQERSSDGGGYAWNSGKHRLGGWRGVLLGTHRVGGSLAGTAWWLTPSRQENDPTCRVGGVRAKEERHPEVYDRNEQTPDRVLAERPDKHRFAFEQQEGKVAASLKPSQLWPERSLQHIGLEATNRLALDDSPRRDHVVAHPKTFEPHDGIEGSEFVWHTTSPFVQIHSNDRSKLRHLGSVPTGDLSKLVSVQGTDTEQLP